MLGGRRGKPSKTRHLLLGNQLEPPPPVLCCHLPCVAGLACKGRGGYLITCSSLPCNASKRRFVHMKTALPSLSSCSAAGWELLVNLHVSY